MKPTYGRISRAGAFLFCESFDHVGPFARSVRDLALAFDVLHGPIRKIRYVAHGLPNRCCRNWSAASMDFGSRSRGDTSRVWECRKPSRR